MENIDSLDIQISASAQSASASLDRLIGKLDVLSNKIGSINGSGLTGLANGVSRLGTAMQSMNNVKTTDFTRLAKNIEKLGNINTAGLNTAASSLSQVTRALNNMESVSKSAQQLGELSGAISKLGYKSVGNAITNIPQLATSMKGLMQTLSTAPQVSNNLIQMTNALANFASQGSRVGSSSRSLISGLNGYSTSAERATKKTMSLAAAFGKFYASYFLVIRGVRKLWGSIESSMDYIETLNYFNAAFGQVADTADLSQWKTLGYDSAEEYYNSFEQRAKELTSKMSGFNVNENGTLTPTGGASLGINPEQMMNYQAMFGQMASSMGVAAETSTKLSQALTEIGADLASVKNLDFADVWEDMASGMAGMSRTLDKYGVNIRNVNLQQKLSELGIEANIMSLNQNDKALLRTIILLDSTRYAWADLSETLNQPANQLRLLESNFANLARTIGNLFLPIVQKVLPYINGLVIALQRLVSWFGSLIGLDLSKITSSVGDGGDSIGGLLDDSEDLAGSLDNAAGAAKKLKQQVLGIDELNINAPQEDSGKGTGTGGGISSGLLDSAFNDAFSEYQTAWDEAFAKVENTAQKIADSIEKAFEPVKKIIQDFSVGDFFQAGQDVSGLVISITDFFANAIDKVDWYGIGRKIGDFLAGLDWVAILKSVGNLIWQALKATLELAAGVFVSAPLETTLISLAVMPKMLKAITASKFVTGITKLWKGFKVLGEKSELVAGTLLGNKAAASGLAILYPKLSDKLTKLTTGFSNFGKSIQNNGFFKTIGSGVESLRNSLGVLQKGLIGVAAVGIEFTVLKDAFYDITIGSDNFMASIGKIAGVAAAASAALYVAFGPAGLAVSALTVLTASIIGVTNAQKEALEKFAEERELSLFGDHVSNITTRLNESAQATRDRMSASLEYVQNAGIGEMQLAKDLADRYFNLAEKENKTNEETEEMQRLAGLLVEKAPELYQYYDEQTGLINGTKDAIGDVIEARLREIQLNAVSEKLTEAYKERVDVLTSLGEAADVASKAQDEMKRLQSEYNELAKMDSALKAYYDIGELRGKGISQLDDSVESQNLLNTAIDAGATYTSDLLELQNQLKAILEQNGVNIPKTLYESTVGFGKQISDVQYEMELFSEKYKSAWDAFTEQKTALETAESTISQLSKMMSEGMVGVGEDFGSGYEEGILSKVANVEKAAEEMGDSTILSLQKAQDSNSPSKVTERLGKDFVDGYNLGIFKNTNSSILTVSTYMQNIINKLSQMQSAFYGIGSNTMQGLLNGMSSMENALYSKANSIANNIANTIQKALDIHSPSRVMFSLGEFTMAGFQNGMESLYKPIVQSLESFGKNVSIAPAPQYSSAYGDYSQISSMYKMPTYESKTERERVRDNSETNSLLRELIYAVNQGRNISINVDGRDLVEIYDSRKARNGYQFT